MLKFHYKCVNRDNILLKKSLVWGPYMNTRRISSHIYRGHRILCLYVNRDKANLALALGMHSLSTKYRRGTRTKRCRLLIF